MNTPTNQDRLQGLVGLFEVATTDGECRLDSDQVGDVYLWLQWTQDAVQHLTEEMRRAEMQDDAPRFNEIASVYGVDVAQGKTEEKSNEV